MAQLLVTTGLFATQAAAATALTNTAISIGLGLVTRALTPDQVIKQQGPRLAESQITGSTEGSPITRIAGTMRIGGQMIWATTFLETVAVSTASRGGKGGPKAVTQSTEYIYSCSFAISLCEADGDVTIGRIWMDGKETDTSKMTYRFYDGAQTEADEKIEAVEGIGTVPAFNGVAYIIFENLELTEYGNRIPQVTVELVRDLTLLSDIVTELCARVGYDSSRVDVSALRGADKDIGGMLVGSISSPRSILENLMSAHLFDVVEDGDQLRFYYRKDSPRVSIEFDDLVISGDNPTSYQRVRKQDEDLPDRTQVDFIDPLRDYNAASVDGHTVTGNSRRVTAFTSLTTLDTGYARGLADILTHEQWVGRDSISFTLPFGSTTSGAEYYSAQPGSYFTLDGFQYRITRRTLGDDIAVEAVGFVPEIYDPLSHESALGFQDVSVTFGASTMIFAELPLVSAESPAPYSPRVIAYQDPWPVGVAIYQNDGSGGETLNTTVLVEGVYGQTTTSFGRGDPWSWDMKNTVTVQLVDENETLFSVSDETVLSGANTLAVKGPTGEWEVFQFANAELNPDGTYTLSRLLRGQLGTEPYIGDPTPPGSTVVLYDTGRWGALTGSPEVIGRELFLRYGPASELVSDDRFTDETVVPRGVAYRPYAPSGLKQTVGGGDITFSWVRRTRFDGDSWQTEDVPLHEEYEKYRVTVYVGLTVVRTWDVDDSTSTVYTQAQQIEDFGSAQSSVTWAVQQVSAIFGAGSPATDG